MPMQCSGRHVGSPGQEVEADVHPLQEELDELRLTVRQQKLAAKALGLAGLLQKSCMQKRLFSEREGQNTRRVFLLWVGPLL